MDNITHKLGAIALPALDKLTDRYDKPYFEHVFDTLRMVHSELPRLEHRFQALEYAYQKADERCRKLQLEMEQDRDCHGESWQDTWRAFGEADPTDMSVCTEWFASAIERHAAYQIAKLGELNTYRDILRTLNKFRRLMEMQLEAMRAGNMLYLQEVAA